MNDGRTIFSQLISFLPDREFHRSVARYRGDSRLRGLSCWEQFLAMAFAQLTYRESLRDIEACLRALGAKRYHLGFRSMVARSTLHPSDEDLSLGTQVGGVVSETLSAPSWMPAMALRRAPGWTRTGRVQPSGMSRIARVELNRPHQRSSSTHRERWCRLDEVDVL